MITARFPDGNRALEISCDGIGAACRRPLITKLLVLVLMEHRQGKTKPSSSGQE